MRVLLVHNYYQRRGGEDHVFEVESDILERHGHAVERLTFHNDDVSDHSAARLAAKTIWSETGRKAVEEAARAHRADVVHFHNTLPLISPAGYLGARAAGAAVVHTLHNFRLICPGALLYRDGGICEDCVGKAFAASAIAHACYRGSRAATAAVATANAFHHARGTWHDAVDRYIAITSFARSRFVNGGLPADKIAVKANTLSDIPEIAEGGGGYAFYAARLDTGKGVETLVKTWLEHEGLPPLVIAGDGPLSPIVAEAAQTLGDQLVWAGWQDAEGMLTLSEAADLYVFPSEWHEGGTPISFLEALSIGLPVVSSDIGTVKCMIEEGREGRFYPAGDSAALADTVRRVWADKPKLAEMRKEARETFLRCFTPTVTHEALVAIYDDAIAERHHADA